MRVKKRFPKERTTITLDHKTGLVLIQSPLIETGNNLLRTVLQDKEFEKFAIKLLAYSNNGIVSYLFHNKYDIQQFIANNKIPSEYTTNQQPDNTVYDIGNMIIIAFDSLKFLFVDNEIEYRPYYFPLDKGSEFESLKHHNHNIGIIFDSDNDYIKLETALLGMENINKFYMTFLATEKKLEDCVWLSYSEVINSPKITDMYKNILRSDPIIKREIHPKLSKYDQLVEDMIS